MDTKSILGIIARRILTWVGILLVQHGVLGNDPSSVTTFVGACMVLLDVGWSLYEKYARNWVLAHLAKATGIAPQSNTTGEAVKAATDAAKVAAVIVSAIMVTGMLFSGDASAQQRRTTPPAPPAQPGIQLPFDPLHLNTQTSGQTGTTPGGQAFHLTDQLIADVLPDLKYAAALAKASNNKITTPCLQAVLDMVTTWQAPLLGADGQPIPLPDKHLITDMERAAELLNALQPDSPLSLGCAATAQAVQKDVATLVGSILSGGALGLFKVAPLAGL